MSTLKGNIEYRKAHIYSNAIHIVISKPMSARVASSSQFSPQSC